MPRSQPESGSAHDRKDRGKRSFQKLFAAGFSRSKNDGLTLIELLAVIAVIGILAAILIPVTAAARDAAKAAACQSNLREIGAAVYLFAADHSDWTPPNVNPEIDPPRPDNLAGTFVGGPSGDVRTFGWLISEEVGGPPGSTGGYIDDPSLLFCPNFPKKVYSIDPQYKPPGEIRKGNPMQRAGYVWIYRVPPDENLPTRPSPFSTRNPNHKVTVENKNVPYAFDFGWQHAYGHQSGNIAKRSHRGKMNTLHLGGHVTSIPLAVADQHEGHDAIYQFLAGISD